MYAQKLITQVASLQTQNIFKLIILHMYRYAKTRTIE